VASGATTGTRMDIVYLLFLVTLLATTAGFLRLCMRLKDNK